MERLTVFDGEFWIHKNFPPVEEDRVDEFIDCVKELAARLAAIEDILGDEYDLGKLMELVQAKREGRIVLRSAGAGKKCGSCGHFHRIPGTKRGTCAIRRWERNRLGQTEPWRHSFTPSQSYGACREYVRGESSATEL